MQLAVYYTMLAALASFILWRRHGFDDFGVVTVACLWFLAYCSWVASIEERRRRKRNG